MVDDTRSARTLSSVRQGYDRWSRIYDRDDNPLLPLEAPIVQRAIGDPRGLRVLDLGCGTGRHSVWLSARGAAVTAVDFSEGMLNEAHAKPGAASIRFVRHDLHDPLPFLDAAFDLAVSGLVLEHLQHPASFLREIHRVLCPNGRAIISVMHPAMFLRGTEARFTDPDSGELVQPGSVLHSLSDYVMAAAKAGFSFEAMGETSPDADFAVRYPRASRYVGWPMLVVFQLRA